MIQRGKVIRQARIYRADLQANPHRLYVFGDNIRRVGYGGQAKEMRGEPNAVGVPTKWRPSMDRSAYFTDADLSSPGGVVRTEIDSAFAQIELALAEGRDVVIPADGLGTGLARLHRVAPKIHAYIEAAIAQLEKDSPT